MSPIRQVQHQAAAPFVLTRRCLRGVGGTQTFRGMEFGGLGDQLEVRPRIRRRPRIGCPGVHAGSRAIEVV